ncbi:MAG: hypothetical protein WC505_04015 [Patescibacteria group bacterium]
MQPIQKQMWGASLATAAILLVALLVYAFIYHGAAGLLAISQAVAGAAGFLIGISFLLGPLAYFYKPVSLTVAYRKYIGLTGFWLALAYSVLLMFVDSDTYYANLFANVDSAEVLLGLIAIAILAFMALISNQWGIRLLGPKRWRWGLRLGYIAYTLLVVRGYLLEKNIWHDWIVGATGGLPPPRLILTLFALSVMLLRIVVMIQKKWKKERLQSG